MPSPTSNTMPQETEVRGWEVEFDLLVGKGTKFSDWLNHDGCSPGMVKQFISDLLVAERQRVIEEAIHFAEQYILDSRVGHPQKVILSKNLYRVALKHDIRVGTTQLERKE